MKPSRKRLISTRVIAGGVALAGALAVSASLGPGAVANGTATRGADCNGLGAVGQAKPVSNYGCTEIRRSNDGSRAEINDTYVGHDEPLVSYYSHKPGSGNNVQFRVKLPIDPPRPPNGRLDGPISTFQLYPAFWLSMVLCDTESFPETTKTCKPDSDSNIQVPFTETHAGTAFLETQFYPPGWSPFINQFSCDQTHWCASMHINSLQGNFDFSVVNENCVEPTAFAFIQRNGKPTGPAGPDNFTDASFTPNAQTLLMNPGDDLRVTIRDTRQGLLNKIEDLTTGQTGMMVGSARNGFRHIIWDPRNFTCQGEPYTYHPMYATSSPPRGQSPTTWAGWTAHTVNVSASLEIGHFERPDAGNDPDGEEGPCFPGPTIPGCIGSDLDFDGYSYHHVYPDGKARHPTPILWSSPTSRRHGGGAHLDRFGQVNLETDLPAIEVDCNVFTGEGCTNPPAGAKFYPFPHTMQPSAGFPARQRCQWTIGANHPQQKNAFGGTSAAAWGPLETTDFGGGFVAALNYATGPFANPCP
jgi:hypothetical protein